MGRDISRRRLMAGAGALAAAGAVAGLPVGMVQAKAPFLRTQVPYFYRFPHGRMQATIVSDGPLPIGDPVQAFKGTSPAELTKLLSESYLSTSNVVLEQNALVVNTGDKLVLFDTGLGPVTMFGTTTGRLRTSLREASIQPEQIDAVVLSHAHPDHVAGLVDARGRRNFPNAQIYLSQADHDFWTDEKKLAGELKDFVRIARSSLTPYRGRIIHFKDGQEILPGITAMAAPGHTVGHCVFMITSEAKSLCYAGDLAHHQIIAIQRPRIEFAFDTDAKQAAQTRVRMLDMLASKRIPLLAYHFAWPGFGHVSKHADGFRYYAAPMEIVPIPAKKKS